jgi:hypothetical protein
MKGSCLVEWATKLLLENVKKIILKREALGVKQRHAAVTDFNPEGKACLDEVTEVIKLPKFDAKVAALENKEKIINSEVSSQLREYVSVIASMYHDNPFHNFEHACHVTMAVDKFIKRIVAPEINEDLETDEKRLASRLHDYTHGINSDPLSLFAIVFSALIHDVDHRGVSNVQLAKEEAHMADVYKNKSIAEQNSLDNSAEQNSLDNSAEQNSLDNSWNVLMSDQFEELRAFIFADKTEMLRFHQMIGNAVLATDIFDKELNDLRKTQWAKSFGEEIDGVSAEDDNDLGATIVIDHIIHASDVSHTMQHWYVDRKWNERLFCEMYQAYRGGAMAVDHWPFGTRVNSDSSTITSFLLLRNSKIAWYFTTGSRAN